MSSPLLHRVQKVQASARRLICLYALARLEVAVIAAAIGLCFIDYLLRLHDPLARWLVSASFVALIAASYWKLALPVLRSKRDLIATARRIELRIPELGERLSSAILRSP